MFLPTPAKVVAMLRAMAPFSAVTLLSLCFALSLSPIAIVSAHDHRSSPACKAVPGTPDWPSDLTWARLNESTGGRLLRPSPPGAVCHPDQPTYDAAECSRVHSAWSTYEFHQNDPVSSQWNQYNNDTCLPEPSYSCSGQGYPVFVINATSAEHVKLGVDFGES